MNIRSRLILYFIIIFLVPMSVLSFVLLRNSQINLESQIVTRLETISESLKGQIEHFLTINSNIIKSFASTPRLVEEFAKYTKAPTKESQATLNNDLQNAIYSFEWVKSISLIDLSGVNVASTDKSKIGSNVSGEQFFIEGQKRTSIFFVENNGNIDVSFVTPVYYNSKVIGLIRNVLPIDILKDMLASRVGLGETGEAQLAFVGKNGPVRFIVKRLHEEQIVSAPDNMVPMLAAIGGQEKSFISVNDYRGVKVIATTRYIKEIGSGLVVKIDEDEARMPLENVLMTTLSVSIFSAICAIIIALFLSNKISRPIRQLSEITEKISRSGTKVVFYEKLLNSVDEIGVLSRNFKTLVDKLTSDIAKRKEAESSLLTLTQELAVKTEEAKDSEKAALNIAQDLKEESERLSTEKIKAESLANELNKFKLALDNTSDQVTITDPDGIVMYANDATTKVSLYRPSEVIGKKAGELWKLPMPKEYYSQMWHTIREEKQAFIGEIQNRRKNGEIYIAMITISPVLNERKEILFFVSIERDITKEKEIDKAKSEFISLASHQMRTPLTTISWYSEMLLGGDAGELSAKQNEYFKAIHTAGLQMNEILKSFLHILRLESNEVASNPVSVKLSEITDSIIKDLQLDIEKKKLNIVKQYQESLQKALVDKEILHVVLQNLISNAVKYTASSGEITVSISSVSEGSLVGKKVIEKDSFLVSVKDTGIGIARADQDKIFGKFFRTDEAKKWDPNGNGIGLYMVNKMVYIFDGTVWFESEDTVGTTFYVLIPINDTKAGTIIV